MPRVRTSIGMELLHKMLLKYKKQEKNKDGHVLCASFALL